MKKQILIIVIFIFITKLSLGQDWLWAKQIGSSSGVKGGARIDANNNIYCSGNFNTNCYFDHDTLNALGCNDVFLAKFDANGNELWAKRIGGNNPSNFFEWFGGSVIDNNNACIYFSGRFYGSLTIDGHTVNSSGGMDMFLAKFDLSGNCLWLKRAGSGGDDNSGMLCLDGLGNLYTTGQLSNNGTFDTINLPKGIFLAKLGPNGNILWARNEISGGDPITSAYTIRIINNNIIMSGVAGNYTIIIGTTPLISTNQVDGFIAKLDLSGNCIKAKRFNGHLPNYACDFVTDINNNIYLSGIFEDTLIIDNTTLTNTNGSWEMYFCKFDSAFNLKWIRQSYSTGINGAHANGVIKDSEGKFYLSGYFSGNATFGTFNISSSVTKDMFIARYDENGNCIGIRHFGEAEAGSIATGSISIDSNGDLIVGGDFKNTINIGNTALTSYGNQDMFFAKATPITGIVGPPQNKTNNQLLIYANPTTGKCTITVPVEFLNETDLTLSIFNNSGKLIQQQKLEMNEGKIKLDLDAEAKGIYTAVLSNGKKSYTGKIVFE